jgi:gas vesicle protein
VEVNAMARDKRKKRRGFLLGATIGAVAGVLLAPRPGKETRDRLFGGRFDMEGQGQGFGEAAGDESANDRSDTLKQKIEETRDRLRKRVGADPE